jgi:hypothetical protein
MEAGGNAENGLVVALDYGCAPSGLSDSEALPAEQNIEFFAPGFHGAAVLSLDEW